MRPELYTLYRFWNIVHNAYFYSNVKFLSDITKNIFQKKNFWEVFQMY